MHRLFHDFAHRYDLHTPSSHYRHDHAFVLELAKAAGHCCRLLDVGCGTGVLIEKARCEGMNATGIDASPAMIGIAQARLGPGGASVRRMQELDERDAYDMIASLSWCVNYCEGRAELLDVMRRFCHALRPGGRLLLQVAHAAHVSGRLMQDREAGPGGEPEDVLFLYRFTRMEGDDWPMRAEYVYACRSLNELLCEQHSLRVADAHVVADCAREAGLTDVVIYDSFRQDPFSSSPSPFVSALKSRDGS